MKKNIKSLFVVLSALVFGLSINYLYSAYGPTAPAPGLPGDLPVITEIYKTDGATNYWQEKGGAPAGGGIPGSVLDISREFKIDNLLVFKNLVVGPTLPKSLAINALSPINTEQNVCSVTAEGKIVLCDPAPMTPSISISFDPSYGSCNSSTPGNVTVIINNPTSSPMSVRYKKYTIGHDVYTSVNYNHQHLESWVEQVVNTTQNPYMFTTPAKSDCFLDYDSVMLVEVETNGQLYIDTGSVNVIRGTLGGQPGCEHCDPGAPNNNNEGGLN